MKWYKHQTNAHRNNGILKLIHKYGSDGYAIYFYSLELIASDVGFDGKNNPTFELKQDAETIGIVFKIDQKRVEEIMIYMVNLGLFEETDGVITCFKIAKYLEKKNTRNKAIHAVIDAMNPRPPTVPRQSPDRPPTVPQHAPLEVEVEVEVEVERTKKVQVPLVDASKEKASTSSNKRKKPIPFLEIQKIYNAKFGYEPWARSSNVLTEKTERQIRRVSKHLTDVDQWGRYFAWGAADEWINGTTRDSDWKPDIDYMTRDKTFAKLTDELHDRQRQR